MLQQAEKGRFPIILPWDAWFMYRLKRYFPKFVLRLFRLGKKLTDVVQERLRRKYETMAAKGKVVEEYLEWVFGKGRTE